MFDAYKQAVRVRFANFFKHLFIHRHGYWQTFVLTTASKEESIFIEALKSAIFSGSLRMRLRT